MEVNEKAKKLLEQQILSFLIRDKKFVKKLFIRRSRSNIIGNFSCAEEKYVAIAVLDYYENYQASLVENEFKNIADNALKKNEIKEGDYKTYLEAYEGAKSLISELDENQYERIYTEWIEAETAPKAKEIVLKHQHLIHEGKGVEFVEKIRDDLKNIHSDKKTEEKIGILDVSKDKQIQIKDVLDKKDFPEQYKAIRTGYKDLDKYFEGFFKGTLNFVGGLSNHGKSTFVLNLASNISKRGKKVLVLSLEMTKEKYARMLNAKESRLDIHKLNNPEEMTEEEFARFEKVVNSRTNNLIIVDFPANIHTWEDIINFLDENLPEYEPDIIFIDQFSLIALQRHGNNDRHDILLGDQSKAMRSYAKIKNIPLVVAVQANRSSIFKDKKTNRTIIQIELENIEDSNKPGQDADSFLTTEIKKLADSDTGAEMIIGIKKQREGVRDIFVTLKTELSRSLIFDEESLMNEDYIKSGDPDLVIELEKREKEDNQKISSLSPDYFNSSLDEMGIDGFVFDDEIEKKEENISDVLGFEINEEEKPKQEIVEIFEQEKDDDFIQGLSDFKPVEKKEEITNESLFGDLFSEDNPLDPFN